MTIDRGMLIARRWIGFSPEASLVCAKPSACVAPAIGLIFSLKWKDTVGKSTRSIPMYWTGLGTRM